MLTEPNRQTVIRLPQHRVQLLRKLQTYTHKQNRSYCLSRRLQHCIRTTGAERSQPHIFRQKKKRNSLPPKKAYTTKECRLGDKQKTFFFFSLFDSRLTWDILLFITFSRGRNNWSINTTPGLMQAFMHLAGC